MSYSHQQGSANANDPYDLSLNIIAELKLIKAKVIELESKVASLEAQISLVKDANDKWFKIIIILLSILGAIIGAKIYIP